MATGLAPAGRTGQRSAHRPARTLVERGPGPAPPLQPVVARQRDSRRQRAAALRTLHECTGATAMTPARPRPIAERRSEEHTSELQSLMRISSDVFCYKNKN